MKILPSSAFIGEPAQFTTTIAPSRQNIFKTEYYEAMAAVEKIPLWVRSVNQWFSSDVIPHGMSHLRVGAS